MHDSVAQLLVLNTFRTSSSVVSFSPFYTSQLKGGIPHSRCPIPMPPVPGVSNFVFRMIYRTDPFVYLSFRRNLHIIYSS